MTACCATVRPSVSANARRNSRMRALAAVKSEMNSRSSACSGGSAPISDLRVIETAVPSALAARHRIFHQIIDVVEGDLVDGLLHFEQLRRLIAQNNDDR